MPLELRELVVTAEIVGDNPEDASSSVRPASCFEDPAWKRQWVREITEGVLEALARRKED